MRTRPSDGFLERDRHRHWLTFHALAMLFVLAVLFALNRRFSPGRLWALWVALAWLGAFLVHLAIFSRATLKSMGAGGGGRGSREKKRSPDPRPPPPAPQSHGADDAPRSREEGAAAPAKRPF